ncbi:peptide/nickel transport system permease protein [Neorhizobium huautlense]|uniref:Peptide/nickel transport system permease protein n=1 Tax=Neorhizobium huautlense TaxID=67774 RepID=A0ABT9PX63_9HYPH|nr:hypothetical protein [Neorhizobium huautlense]MDP9838344.1 peptide/nickel transport system permease protein [Neorhizobium huautlense]
MNLKTVLLAFLASVLLALLTASFLLPYPDAMRHDLANRLMPPGAGHIFGTDALGRDLFSRFVIGSRFTILTALATALLAAVTGLLLSPAAKAAPKTIGRLVIALAYIAFVVPSFLLSPRWQSRALMSALTLVGLLPMLIVALSAMSAGGFFGWPGIFISGPLWGIGVGYVLFRGTRGDGDNALVDSANRRRCAAALVPAIFTWSAWVQFALDYLGLGLQAPVPSWGGLLLVADNASATIYLACFSGLLAMAIVGLGVSAMIARPVTPPTVTGG